jgi:ABC-type phosphate transport system, permease component
VRATSRRVLGLVGRGILFGITSVAAIGVLFIFLFIARDAIPFFQLRGFAEFLTSTHWYPSADKAEFGVLAIFVGSGLVTLGAVCFAVPLGVAASVCLSDVLPFTLRQLVKPIIEILAAIPSVAYGFFALVVFAPLLQEDGGRVLAVTWWVVATPLFVLATIVASDLLTSKIGSEGARRIARVVVMVVLGFVAARMLRSAGAFLEALKCPAALTRLTCR